MVSSVLSSLVCVLCVILLPAVWADYCRSYVDSSGYQHQVQQCGSVYCCGNCQRMYCCQDRLYRLTSDEQKRCTGSTSGKDKSSRLATLLGSILGSVFPIVICVGLIICCLAPCCFLYKKCRKGGNRGRQTSRNTPPTVIHVPQPPQPPQPPHPSPSGYQPYPGYQPVPAQPGYGGLPMPSAPPAYMEATDPGPGVPMVVYPGQPYPGQPYGQPSYPDVPTPYNPSYAPNPQTE